MPFRDPLSVVQVGSQVVYKLEDKHIIDRPLSRPLFARPTRGSSNAWDVQALEDCQTAIKAHGPYHRLDQYRAHKRG